MITQEEQRHQDSTAVACQLWSFAGYLYGKNKQIYLPVILKRHTGEHKLDKSCCVCKCKSVEEDADNVIKVSFITK